MGVVAVLPDLSGLIFASRKGKAALDELRAAFDGVICGRRDDGMDVVGHDDEGVEKEAVGVSIAE